MKSGIKEERPNCYGLGMDNDSRQFIPIETCQSCPFDKGCSMMRQARAIETQNVILERIADHKFSYGKGGGRNYWRQN